MSATAGKAPRFDQIPPDMLAKLSSGEIGSIEVGRGPAFVVFRAAALDKDARENREDFEAMIGGTP